MNEQSPLVNTQG